MAVFLERVALEGRFFTAGESEGEGVDTQALWHRKLDGEAVLAALAGATADLLNPGAAVAERGNKHRTNTGPVDRFIADDRELIPMGRRCLTPGFRKSWVLDATSGSAILVEVGDRQTPAVGLKDAALKMIRLESAIALTEIDVGGPSVVGRADDEVEVTVQVEVSKGRYRVGLLKRIPVSPSGCSKLP